MGAMQKQLERLLCDYGEVSDGRIPRPRLHDVLTSAHASAIDRVYRALGGIQLQIPAKLGRWDLEFEGIAVELDEQLHFNRYRMASLQAPAYSSLPNFPLTAYKQYCSQYEAECLRAGGYGGKWSNPSCDSQFGSASPPKDLSGNGSSRWRQRAFYDFVKDLSPLLRGVPVARIAIWDVVQDGERSRTIRELLETQNSSSGAVLAEFVRARVT